MLVEIPDPPPFSTIFSAVLLLAVLVSSFQLYRQQQIISALQKQDKARHTRHDYTPPSSPSYPNPLQNAPHFVSNFRSPSMSSLESPAPKTLDDVCKHLVPLNSMVSDLLFIIKHSRLNSSSIIGATGGEWPVGDAGPRPGPRRIEPIFLASTAICRDSQVYNVRSLWE